MIAQAPKDLVPKFFDNTALTYDKVVNLATFGKDKYWKKEILKKIQPCASVLDLACGTGILTRQISDKLPKAKITGVDITHTYLDVAKQRSKSYQNISFVYQDAEKLHLDFKFDCITSSYIPKYCNAKILVKNCLDHLNDGGKIILHDFVYPNSSVVRKLWNLYFVLLALAGNFVPSWNDVFDQLPKLIRSSTWVDDYQSIMKKHGLHVQTQFLTWGSSVVITGTKKIV